MSIADKLTAIAENEHKVYEAGKQASADAFWNELQQNGELKDYDYIFTGRYWTGDNFKPKYTPITPLRAVSMFQYASNLNIDISEIVDFSNCAAISNTFNESAITGVGTINATLNANNRINYGFLNARKLKTIGKLIVSESIVYTQTFDNCAALENITFEGKIGNNINFQWSTKLTKDSLYSIRDALYVSSVGSAKTATFSKTAVNAAFGVDVDDELTFNEEFVVWQDRTNWIFKYA